MCLYHVRFGQDAASLHQYSGTDEVLRIASPNIYFPGELDGLLFSHISGFEWEV